MGSLGDQFLKKGLVSKTKLNQAKTEKHKSKKTKLKKQQKIVVETLHVKAQSSDKQEQIKQDLAKREMQAKIKDLLNAHVIKIDRKTAEEKYYFTLNNKLDFVYVSTDLKIKLSKRQIGITKFLGQYYILPASICEKLIQINSEQYYYLASKSSSDDTDGYEDYQIPDDITW